MQRNYFIKILNFILVVAVSILSLACPAQFVNDNIGDARPSKSQQSFAVWKADIPKNLPADSEVTLHLTLLNNGSEAWDSSSGKPCFISYHWKHPGGRFDSKMFWGIKTPLPELVGVAELVEVDLKLKTPLKAKYYDLIIDIVRGDSVVRTEVSWFEEAGSKTYDTRLEVIENGK